MVTALVAAMRVWTRWCTRGAAQHRHPGSNRTVPCAPLTQLRRQPRPVRPCSRLFHHLADVAEASYNS
eukprot:scaffold11257_cov133-Isochrysis_galbana.AAC.2